VYGYKIDNFLKDKHRIMNKNGWLLVGLAVLIVTLLGLKKMVSLARRRYRKSSPSEYHRSGNGWQWVCGD
jgi:hypothetical protein